MRKCQLYGHGGFHVKIPIKIDTKKFLYVFINPKTLVHLHLPNPTPTRLTRPKNNNYIRKSYINMTYHYQKILYGHSHLPNTTNKHMVACKHNKNLQQNPYSPTIPDRKAIKLSCIAGNPPDRHFRNPDYDVTRGIPRDAS